MTHVPHAVTSSPSVHAARTYTEAHVSITHLRYAHPSEPALFIDLSAVFSTPLTGLIGDNGCGKTTLMRLILGDLTPDSGSVVAPERMAYLPQDLGLDREQTLAELCGISEILWALQAVESGEYSPELYETIGDNWDIEERILAALATYGFTPAALVDRDNPEAVRALFARQMHSFSGGEAVIAALASLMISDPEFILLDEPFAGIDPIAVIEIQRIISFLKERGIGVLITDHNVRETLGICDHAFIISDGTVLAQGTPQEIVENPDVRRVYLGEHFRM